MLKKELEKENNLLWNKIKELEEQLKQSISTKEEPIEIIPMHKIIHVQSLYNGVLNLKTTSNADGPIFKFNFFGDKQPIFYSELVKCLSLQNRFFKDGFVIILDESVVKAHYLVEFYKDLLNAEQIENFIHIEEEQMNNIYPKLTTQQKITVLERIAINLNNNPNKIDRNKLDIITKISKVNINDLAAKLK